MITETEKGQIFHPDKGFLLIDHRQADIDRENRVYQWFAPATAAHRWLNEHIDRFLEEQLPAASQGLQDQFIGCRRVKAPVCSCCGERPFADLVCVKPASNPNDREYRCSSHRDRNPCAIEGCCRTTKMPAAQPANDRWLCGEHWRRFIPPRSPERRVYHRLFRLAKRHGWTPELRARFWRLWDGMVARARRRSADGHLDQAEIERMFGWQEAPMK